MKSPLENNTKFLACCPLFSSDSLVTAHASAALVTVSLTGFATPTGKNICSNSKRIQLHPVILNFLFMCLNFMFQFCYCSCLLLKVLLLQTLLCRCYPCQNYSLHLGFACVFSSWYEFWKVQKSRWHCVTCAMKMTRKLITPKPYKLNFLLPLHFFTI